MGCAKVCLLFFLMGFLLMLTCFEANSKGMILLIFTMAYL